jgi:hypothetical protein
MPANAILTGMIRIYGAMPQGRVKMASKEAEAGHEQSPLFPHRYRSVFADEKEIIHSAK